MQRPWGEVRSCTPRARRDPTPVRASASSARNILRPFREARGELRTGGAPGRADAGPTHAEAQRALVQPEDAGGLALVPVRQRECLEENLPLHVAESSPTRERVHARRA